MPKSYLFLGSNINPLFHLNQGLSQLKSSFDVKKHTPIFKTSSTVTQEFCFYNMAVLIHCRSSKPLLHDQLRKIEHDCGRVRVANKNADRTLDIDITIFQESDTCSQYPVDPDLYQRHFMAKIFSLLDPDSFIAPLKKSFSDLVETFHKKDRQDIQSLSPIQTGGSS